jgi:RNA polymerase sigma-54 factor
MELELEQSLELSPRQSLKVSPRLVAANYILELSSQELQQTIATELADNPALELLDVPTCQICGSELHGSICPHCIQRQKGAEASHEDAATPYYEDRDLSTASADEEEFDPLTKVASEQTLAERLLSDLGVILQEHDMKIAEYLVGSLDEKGYLSCSVEEAAYELEVDVQRVRGVLKALQSLEPIGIGARNLRECLLIQMDYLEPLGLKQPHAREIVSDYLMELGEHKFGKIAQELKLPLEAVNEVWEFVKSKLNPHPAHGFSATNARDRDTRQMYVLPDVIISRGEDGLEVDVVESKRFMLRLNPMYGRLSGELHGSEANFSSDERKHIQQYVGRAKLFMANINQRRQTLQNITSCLVDRQKPGGGRARARRARVNGESGDRGQVRDDAGRRGYPVLSFLHSVVVHQGRHQGDDRARGPSADRRSDRRSPARERHQHRPSDGRQVPHAARHPAEYASVRMTLNGDHG